MKRKPSMNKSLVAVTCKECKHKGESTIFWKPCDEMSMPSDWFCKYGTKKEEKQKQFCHDQDANHGINTGNNTADDIDDAKFYNR